MPNIVIPGGGGFVGINLVPRLLTDPAAAAFEKIVVVDPLLYGAQGIPQEVLTDPRVRFVRDSIYSPGTLAQVVGPGDVVIHLVAEVNTADHPQDHNADDPLSYLRGLCEAGIARLLFVSSADIYGDQQRDGLLETDPFRPTTIYAAAKTSFEGYVAALHVTNALPAVVLRPVTIYGPHQQPGWLIPVLITRALAGKPITIFGDGTARRDWIHVEDMCALLSAAAFHPDPAIHGEAFNVGTGSESTVLSVVHHVLRQCGMPTDTVEFAPDRPGDIARQIAPALKARRTFGWSPQITLFAGLDTTIAAYRHQCETE